MNKHIRLRAAVRPDSIEIKKLVIAARLNPTGLDWRRFTVAVNANEKVIGCVQIKPHRDGSQELASLVVDGDYQGMGIARKLVADMIRNYAGELYLMCRANLGDFYEKFGFRGIAEHEMPVYFKRVSKLSSIVEIVQKDGETLLIMKHEGEKL